MYTIGKKNYSNHDESEKNSLAENWEWEYIKSWWFGFGESLILHGLHASYLLTLSVAKLYG